MKQKPLEFLILSEACKRRSVQNVHGSHSLLLCHMDPFFHTSVGNNCFMVSGVFLVEGNLIKKEATEMNTSTCHKSWSWGCHWYPPSPLPLSLLNSPCHLGRSGWLIRSYDQNFIPEWSEHLISMPFSVKDLCVCAQSYSEAWEYQEMPSGLPRFHINIS